MFSEIQKMGVVTSLDFSLPDASSESGKANWVEIMQGILPFTDIFGPSLEEALQIMMPEEYAKILSGSTKTDIIDQIPLNLVRELGSKIIESGVKILMIKAGHRGAYLLTGDVSDLNLKRGLNLFKQSWNHKEFWCNAYPAEPEKIKSATGAGDTAAAAFISAILDGESPEKSLKYAAIAGRNNLYCLNIYDEIEGWQEMADEMKICSNAIIHLN